MPALLKNRWSPKSWARLAGLLGLLVLTCGSFTHSVNSKLIDYSNAATTSINLIESENLFRLGYVSGLLMEIIFIFYAFLLFKLLKPVNKSYALLMLILALIPAPIFFVNQLTHFSALLLAKQDMIQEMMFYIDLHKQGGLVISIFFGLWLLPLGYLVSKSRFLPKYLGVFLMIGTLGYLTHFVQGVLFPGSESALWTSPALVVTHLSEISLMLWLLVLGVNVEKYKSWNS